jgi:release factor glutamine methyltransferase
MKTILHYIQSELQGLYSETEIRSLSLLLIEKLTGFSRSEIFLNKNTTFSIEQIQQFESFIEKLKNFVPIQYILGETEFYGLKFLVNESVLIPRPETEELVDWIITDHETGAPLKILDIGTGSGCIAITLKHAFPNATVDAFDISEKGLETALENAILNKTTVNLSKINILDVPRFERKWDIIVSNPPYIPHREKANMLPNVLNYEPHIALFVPSKDPLIFYRQITSFAKNQLKPNGKIYFEINQSAGYTCVNLLKKEGFEQVELRKDIFGKNRMVRAILS